MTWSRFFARLLARYRPGLPRPQSFPEHSRGSRLAAGAAPAIRPARSRLEAIAQAQGPHHVKLGLIEGPAVELVEVGDALRENAGTVAPE